MREISDQEAIKHFKEHVIDKIIAYGKDPEKIKLVKMAETTTVMSAAEIYRHILNVAKGLVDPIGREELEKHKRWMRYKIERGWMK